MASLANSYDPEAALPSDRDPFPAANYPVEITETDVVPTKAGTGQLLKYTVQVTDGEHKGRLVWGQLNLQNQNPTAQEIGQSEFRAMREATGVLAPDDTEDLHYKQFVAAIEVEPAKGDYKAKNKINWRKTVKLLEGGEAVPSKPANDNKPAATGAAPAKRPWGAKK